LRARARNLPSNAFAEPVCSHTLSKLTVSHAQLVDEDVPDTQDDEGEAEADNLVGADAPIYHPAQVEYGGSSFAGMRVLVGFPQKMCASSPIAHLSTQRA
jgi:hypothetical protein